jgi:hypothetical protein
MKALAQRSYSFFKRTISSVILYRKGILNIINDCVAKGFNSICLIGESDMDFIIEHACSTAGVHFKRDQSVKDDKEIFYLVSEQEDPEKASFDIRNNVIYIRSILLSL